MRLTRREKRVLWIAAVEKAPVGFGPGPARGLRTVRCGDDRLIVEARGDAGASLARKGLLEWDGKSRTGTWRLLTQAGHEAARPLVEAWRDWRDIR